MAHMRRTQSQDPLNGNGKKANCSLEVILQGWSQEQNNRPHAATESRDRTLPPVRQTMAQEKPTRRSAPTGFLPGKAQREL
jgi:hypothetical protein